MRRPVIGIPCMTYTDSWYTPANGNAISYTRAIETAGGLVLLIPQTARDDVLAAYYQQCDGLLFAGGTDVEPQVYGCAPHPLLHPPSPDQDTLELALARRAVAEQKPVFGVCRGIQLLNVALGGTLYQDIATTRPDSLDHSESTKQQNMKHLAHQISLTADSWLAGQLDSDEIQVNTLHHQALWAVAPGLKVVAEAPDGVVEAVEGTGAGFVLGVQCHPEELWDTVDQRWARVFRGFVECAGGR